MKKSTHVRLSDLTVRQLAELVSATGNTQTEVIERAIDRMYQQETQTMTSYDRNANSYHSICRYCGSVYNAQAGNHICNVHDLETLIEQERTMTDDPDERIIARLESRIEEVTAFWKAHPTHKSELSHNISA